MPTLPLRTLPLLARPSSFSVSSRELSAVSCKVSLPVTPLFATLTDQPSVSPVFATLTNHPQLTEKKATLSPFPATLTSSVKHKPFVCHSYKKQGGWGYTDGQRRSNSSFSSRLLTFNFQPLPPVTSHQSPVTVRGSRNTSS